MNAIDELTRHPFLLGLPHAAVATLAECARAESFAPGAHILRQGSPATALYLILDGCVQLQVYVPQRGEQPVETLHGGDALGWSWLTPPYKWHFDAVAVGAVQALKLDAMCLRRHMESDFELGYRLQQRLIAVILNRLQASRMQMLDVYAHPYEGSL